MKRRTSSIIIAGVVAAAAIGVGTVVAAGVNDDENETPITGDALDKASAAALVHIGEGRVTGTEVGDEESTYEVEITLDTGNQVDVQLDANFRVVGNEADVESEPGDD